MSYLKEAINKQVSKKILYQNPKNNVFKAENKL